MVNWGLHSLQPVQWEEYLVNTICKRVIEELGRLL